jgi:hypothetical protein
MEPSLMDVTVIPPLTLVPQAFAPTNSVSPTVVPPLFHQALMESTVSVVSTLNAVPIFVIIANALPHAV